MPATIALALFFLRFAEPAAAPVVDAAATDLSEESASSEPAAAPAEPAAAQAPPALAPAPALAPEDEVAFELPTPAPRSEPPAVVKPGSHFVFANHYGLSFGVSPFPSFDQTFFFGGALAAREDGARRLALGYSLTLSLGYADRYSQGLITTRHHVTANFYGGPRERLFAAIGGGGFFFYGFIPTGLEVEGRLGYVFGRLRERRGVGVVGGVARVGWDIRHREYAPLPQLGIFLGVLVR